MEGKEKKPEKVLDHRHVNKIEAMGLISGISLPVSKKEDSVLYKIWNCSKCWDEWHHIL